MPSLPPLIKQRFSHPLPFTKPPFSENLAEFFGIMMGDGSMTRYQISITLHHIDDFEYCYFVKDLINELFDVPGYINHYPHDSVNELRISRVGLIEHLHTLGLPIGNKIKQGLDIPVWIKQRKEYRIACLRGLVDTDGSVFNHCYRVKGKEYCYKKLDFATLSPSLLTSAANIFREIGLHPRINGGKKICLDSIADMKGYFAQVGSHNPKHLKRYYR